MIISCPYCQTSYEVAAEAIGSAGRKVQCASCRRAWQAVPTLAEDDALFAEDEEALDAVFSSMDDEDRDAKVVAMPGVEPPSTGVGGTVAASIRGGETPAQRIATYVQRQRARDAKLPTVKTRRVLRLVAVAMFLGVVGGAVMGREQIVRQVPELAGLYSALGMSVNVVGLDVSRLRSVAGVRDGRDVLDVTAQIGNVAGRLVQVPAIIVAVRDAQGGTLYEWSVAPPVATLDAGESVGFEARLASPPPEAVSVKLSFAPLKPNPSSQISPAQKDAH